MSSAAVLQGKRILLIVGGGIAAYKACELIRLLRRQGATVTCVLTDGGAQFVTPMTLAALSGERTYTSLWDLKDETEMGHIQLSRAAELLIVCPATADLLARMAAGLANDLAATLLLATDKPVLAVPAMNVRMWRHPATRRNIAQLRSDGVTVMEPDEGEMACGEYGPGRLPEVERIAEAIAARLAEPGTTLEGQPDFETDRHRPLFGRHILVTAGPTHEAIDPVRFLANRSSGKQGFAIAGAAAALGARVTLVAGPVALVTPPGVDRIDVTSAREMEAAVARALPADAAIMVAAVADWRAADQAPQKIKKDGGDPTPLALVENPDILARLSTGPNRPRLVVGFAAETEDLVANARAKLARKGCDWIVANDVAGDVLGGDCNRIHIITAGGEEAIGPAPKTEIARLLCQRIADVLA